MMSVSFPIAVRQNHSQSVVATPNLDKPHCECISVDSSVLTTGLAPPAASEYAFTLLRLPLVYATKPELP